MKYVPVLVAACLSALSPAGFVLQCTPELEGPMLPTSSEVSVFSDYTFVPASFCLALEANGDFIWTWPIVPDPFEVDYFVDGNVHYWNVIDSRPHVPELPGYGQLLWMQFTFPQEGSSFVLTLLDLELVPVDSRSFSIVPEPATVCLLGLGVLCLRKGR